LQALGYFLAKQTLLKQKQQQVILQMKYQT
jgi:hypothetical protein